MEMSKLKKILIYLISFITICFILPAIFTNRTAKTSTNDIGEEKTTDKSSGETVVEINGKYINF